MKKQMTIQTVLASATLALAVTAGAQESPGVKSFDSAVQEKNFAQILDKYSEGVADPVPWAGYWWDYKHGGVSNGAFDSNHVSPAAKYDTAKKLEATKGFAAWENKNHGDGPEVADWYGHCNGWAAAAIAIPEPRQSVNYEYFANNRDRLAGKKSKVTFDTGDIKALLTESWLECGSDFIGGRVNDTNDRTSAKFLDVVPAQFHLVMTNLLGRLKQSAVIDRHTGAEVWNQPLVGYRIKPITKADDLGAHPKAPGVYRVKVAMTIWWADDGVQPEFLTEDFTFQPGSESFGSRELRYELWLDGPLVWQGNKLVSSGDIILGSEGGKLVGGEWKNTHLSATDAHPDFMWLPTYLERPSGYKYDNLDDRFIHTLAKKAIPSQPQPPR